MVRCWEEVLHISCRFVHEMHILRTSDRAGRLFASALFSTFFLCKTMSYFQQYLPSSRGPRLFRVWLLPQIYLECNLTHNRRWREVRHRDLGTGRGLNKQGMPSVMTLGISVSDRLFSPFTIPTNTYKYFICLGYQVYIPVVRFAIGRAAEEGNTTFDARLDVKATLEYVSPLPVLLSHLYTPI
jgi:hypothetical protein